MPARFRPFGNNSFWGDCLYEMAVPKTHFLRQLKGLIDWEKLTRGLADCYKGGAEYGPFPYNPTTVLKMLLLSYLYKMSERQIEEYVSDSLAARYFLDLAAHEAVPDHSTLSVFKDRILKRKGPEMFERMFQEVVCVAIEKGIVFGKIQIVDATHTIADVNVKKDKERKDGGDKPRDGDAAWGVKGKKKVRTVDGKMVKVNNIFYGYKTHMSLNAESKIITSVAVTPGNKTDGQQFPELVQKDEQLRVEAKIYAGDKGYDDGDNHYLLKEKGKSSALCLNEYRTRLYPEGLWADIKASEDYQMGLRERYKIEQKNGEGKRWHGLDRCRYVGLAKYAVQSLMTAMTMNLKRMVLLLCGVSFRWSSRNLAKSLP